MEFKPSKDQIGTQIVLPFVMIAPMFFVFGSIAVKAKTVGTWITVVLTWCFLVGSIIRLTVAFGRTLYFNKDGCKVSFLCFSKEYTWDELKYKKYVQYKNTWLQECAYTKAAEFCPHRIKRSKLYKADSYSSIVRPWSFFYVCFYPPKLPSSPPNRFPDFYPADEHLFRQKLAEWGVQMEEVII